MLTPVSQPDLTQLRHIFQFHKHKGDFTYDELARVTGLSRQTLININSGNFHGDLRTWLLLSKAFNTTLDELLTDVWSLQQDKSDKP